MYKIAEEASMSEKLAIQTINEKSEINQTLYNLHLKNSSNIQSIMKLVAIIEADKEEILAEIQCKEVYET
ncbi:hypothetical protein COBT_003754 [Conglomerata obtusa]